MAGWWDIYLTSGQVIRDKRPHRLCTWMVFQACITWGAHQRRLANTTESSMCSGVVCVFCPVVQKQYIGEERK